MPSPPATTSILVAARDLPAGRSLTEGDLRSGDWPSDQVPLGRLSSAAGRVLASPIRAGEPVTDARVLGRGLLAGQAAGLVAVPVRLADAAAGAMVRAGDRIDVLATGPSSTLGSTWSAGSGSTDDEPSDSGDGTEPDENGRASRSTSSATGSGTQRVAAGALVLAAPGSASDSGWPGSSRSGTGGLGGAGGLSGLSGTGGLGGTGLGSGAAGDASGTDTAGLIVLAVPAFEAGRLAAAQAGQALGIVVLPPP